MASDTSPSDKFHSLFVICGRTARWLPDCVLLSHCWR